MKIVKLSIAEVKPATAQAHVKDNGNGYIHKQYNMKHGTSGADFGYWLLPISEQIAKPEKSSDILELTDNKYILIPGTQKGKDKDRLGNDAYKLTIDYTTLHQKDLIVLWDIPNKNYKDVVFTTDGDVDVIGTGYNGKSRGGVLYKSPAPVLEVFGDCNLCWSAVDKNGVKCEQKITYHYTSGDWDIGQITKM